MAQQQLCSRRHTSFSKVKIKQSLLLSIMKILTYVWVGFFEEIIEVTQYSDFGGIIEVKKWMLANIILVKGKINEIIVSPNEMAI